MKPITEALASIAADWPQLLDDTYTISGGGPGGTPSGDVRLPGGTTRLSLIAETQLTLWHWCRRVLNDRPPTHAQPDVNSSDVTAMCAWLRPHADWMDTRYAITPDRAEQEESAQEELDDLASRLRALVAPTGIKRPPVAPCTAPDCPGTIRGYIDTDHPENADLACDAHPDHRWQRDHWVDLGRQVHDPTPQWLTSVELAEWMTKRFGRRITDSQIRTWAWRHPVALPRRHGGRYDRVQFATWYIEHRRERVA